MKQLLTLFFLAFIAFAANNPNRAFIWADDEDYKPMIYKDKNGNPAGIFNDIMTELFKRLNIPLKKAVYPWERAQKLVNY